MNDLPFPIRLVVIVIISVISNAADGSLSVHAYSNAGQYCKHSQTDIVCRGDYDAYLKFEETPGQGVVYENADIATFKEVHAFSPQRWKKVHIHDVTEIVDLTVTETMSEIKINYVTEYVFLNFGNDGNNYNDLFVTVQHTVISVSNKGHDKSYSMKSLAAHNTRISNFAKGISANENITLVNCEVGGKVDYPIYLIGREINIISTKVQYLTEVKANVITMDKCTFEASYFSKYDSIVPFIKADELRVTNSEFDFQPWFLTAPQTQHGQNVSYARYDDLGNDEPALKLIVGTFTIKENTFRCNHYSMRGVAGLGEIGDVNYCRVDGGKVTINEYIRN